MCVYNFMQGFVGRYKIHGCIQRAWGTVSPYTNGKSQVAIGFLRNAGTDPTREAIGPKGSNCYSREVRTTLCEINSGLKQVVRTPSPP